MFHEAVTSKTTFRFGCIVFLFVLVSCGSGGSSNYLEEASVTDDKRVDETQKINTLSMISPITNEEKQKLLEALTIKDKIETLENIISFYLHEVNFNNKTVQ